jgi:uncharacterized protein (DUF427 family)
MKREMKLPGPEHPITIEASEFRMRARYQGHVIADSARALTLKEANYRPVTYFPREDVSMEYFSRTDRVTYCPYKGEARYFTIVMDGHFADNAVWTYETPYPAMEEIRELVAFYPNQVEIVDVGEGDHPDAVREAILHTDDGSGRSQREPWPATAGLPRQD